MTEKGFLIEKDIQGKDGIPFGFIRYSGEEDGNDTLSNGFSKSLQLLHDIMERRKNATRVHQREKIDDEMLSCIKRVIKRSVQLFRWSNAPCIFFNPTPDIKAAFCSLSSAAVITKDGTLKTAERLMFTPNDFFKYLGVREQAFNIAAYDNKSRILEHAPSLNDNGNVEYMGVTDDWMMKRVNIINQAFNATMSLEARSTKLPASLFQGGGEEPDATGHYPVRGILKNAQVKEMWEKALNQEFGHGYMMMRQKFLKSLNPDIQNLMKKALLSEVSDYNWLNGGEGDIDGKERISKTRIELVSAYPIFAKHFINPNRKMGDILFEQEEKGVLNLEPIEVLLAKVFNNSVENIQKMKEISPADLGRDQPLKDHQISSTINALADNKFANQEEERRFLRQNFTSLHFVREIRNFYPEFEAGAYPPINEKGIENIELAASRLSSVLLDFEQIYAGILKDETNSPFLSRKDSRLLMVEAFCGHDSIPAIAKKTNAWYEARLLSKDQQPAARSREKAFSPVPIETPEQAFPIHREGSFLLPSGLQAEFISKRSQLEAIENATPTIPASSLIMGLRGGNNIIHIKRTDGQTVGLMEAMWSDKKIDTNIVSGNPGWLVGTYINPELEGFTRTKTAYEMFRSVRDINDMLQSRTLNPNLQEMFLQKKSSASLGNKMAHFDIASENAEKHNMSFTILKRGLSIIEIEKNIKGVKESIDVMNILKRRSDNFSKRTEYLDAAIQRHLQNASQKPSQSPKEKKIEPHNDKKALSPSM